MINLKIILPITIFLFIQTLTYSATIKGIVTDSRTGEPLTFANVFILDTQIGTSTNSDGFYVIKDLNPGMYLIRASYVVYGSHTDTINIKDPEEVIELNIKLKSPIIDLDSVSDPELEAYHQKIKMINEIKPVLIINIDTLIYSERIVTAHLSMTNNIDEPLYLFKNYPCFTVIKSSITDSNAEIIKNEWIMPDCLCEKTCPDSTDLILVNPGETIKYPPSELPVDFTSIPKGRYSVKISYEFKEPSEINTFYCNGKSVINTLIRGLRGSYISDNIVTFLNK